MYLSVKSWSKFLGAQKRSFRYLLNALILVPIILSACGAAATPTVGQPLVLTPLSNNVQETAAPTSTIAPTNTPVPTSTAALVTSPTSTSPAVQVETATRLPSATLASTPIPTSPVAAATATISPFFINIIADIQNNVNGVLQVLNVSGENGQANIIILNTYKDKLKQYNASFELVKYLGTYFKGVSNPALAKLFGGTQFALHIKSISIDQEYIVDTLTPYEVLAQVALAQVDQGQWEALVNAQIQMQYHVIALCSVSPNTINANSETKLVISAWLLYQSKPVIMQYVTAAWKDSTGHQYYCAGNPYDSSCNGPSGSVNPGSTVTIDVNIQAYDGLQYTCQTTYFAP
jgi:hypothetical protein